MASPSPYEIHTHTRFGFLELIDFAKVQAENPKGWLNYTLCHVNDCVVRIGLIEGEFHWHKHDQEDEFFYVVDGRLLIDLEDRVVELSPKQGFTVPRGVLHRTRAPQRTAIMMVEGSGVVPTGD
jgi:mannose-6-phosphate isomerase-like protein (cupin superfamily)